MEMKLFSFRRRKNWILDALIRTPTAIKEPFALSA
jgi:hypothetical protein